MKKINEKDKLIALAYLHQGKTPKEVDALLGDVSYAQALRLKKELDTAVENNKIEALFDLSETAINTLLDSVKNELTEAASELTGDLVTLDHDIDGIKDRIAGQKLLEVELSKAGVALAKRLTLAINVTHNPENLVLIADALAKLQTAFFKTSNVNIANFEGGKSFEEFLVK